MTTRRRKHEPPPVGTVAWLRWFRCQAPWKHISAQVRAEEPTCWLQLPGCTRITTTADHIIPASVRPELALVRSNLRGACRSCNSRRKTDHPASPRLRSRPARRRPARATGWFDVAQLSPRNGGKKGAITPAGQMRRGTIVRQEWRGRA